MDNRKHSNYILRISVIWVFLLLSINLLANQQQKKILALYSYDPTFPVYINSVNTLYDVFPSLEYEIDIEFLDSKRYFAGELNQTVFDRIKIKIKNQQPYDAVISANDNALLFCVKHQDELFPQTPIVFWGVNDQEIGYAQDSNPEITGIIENISIKRNLNFIKSLHPNSKNITVITDETKTGIADYVTFSIAKADFPEINFTKISIGDYTLNQFKEVVNAIRPEEIVLVLSALRSKDGYHTPNEINTILKSSANKKIYNHSFYQPGMNLAGGIRQSFYKQAFPACLITKQILNGTPISQIKVSLGDHSNIFVLDYARMHSLGINIENVPDFVEIQNRPSTNINLEKDLILKIVLLLVAFFLLLAFGLFRINKKHKLEKSLRINAENYSSIFKDNHSVMLIIDPSTGKVEDANEAACEFYGYRYEEFKDLKVTDINKTPNFDLDGTLKAIAKKNLRVQVKHQLKNGTIKDVEVSAGRIELNDGINLFAIIHDISDRIKNHKQLVEARKKAEESDYLKSAFLANMSHEIRTPMNIILGFTSLLDDPELTDATKKKYLNLIQDSGEHLLNLINDIIDLSKIEANQLNIRIQECKLNRLMEEVFDLFNNQLSIESNKEIKLILSKGIENPDFTIKTDTYRLKQILLNLLGNALKFTESGEISFGYIFRDDSVLQFFIKDTGIGIPDDKKESIFSAFEQVEDATTRNFGGTGLGLSITKSLVEKLGGHIWVMSELGKGSRFYFTISTTTNLLYLD
ncbi:ATP-binding protein [Sunxiuqinia sp. A32]|uniref:ATP-binding protein n=1 Tax=Sunxiuqinia sp. A32 TaxID=3461496 RepID=UPI0040461BFD